MSKSHLEELFPTLVPSGYRITSPATPAYNCIAWAAEDADNWWWPIPVNPYYWPVEIPADPTIQSFVEAFAKLGYQLCEDGQFEPHYEKVAIYADEQGEPTHMARQLNSGKWTSKLGRLEDIEHFALSSIEGETYGRAIKFLRRQRLSHAA